MTIGRLGNQADLDVPLPKPGRPSISMDTDNRKIMRDFASGERDTAMSTAKLLTETSEKSIHQEAVSRVLVQRWFNVSTKSKILSLLETP